MQEILEGKLTLRATRTEPSGVTVALLGRHGCATMVDARAQNTAVRVVHALLLNFAPRTVIETVAPALACQGTSMTATVFFVMHPIANLAGGKIIYFTDHSKLGETEEKEFCDCERICR